jgi:uncharacterized RmlC-like cupin family protein
MEILMLEQFLSMEVKMKIIERTHDTHTNEIIDIERDETAAETKARLDYVKAIEAAQVEAEAKAAARQVVLQKLGLTADEAAALLG